MKFNIEEEEKCPECGHPLLTTDIAQRLFDTGNSESLQDAQKDAASYGWTSENKKRITNLETIVSGGLTFYRCPSCETVWDGKSRQLSGHETSLVLAYLEPTS